MPIHPIAVVDQVIDEYRSYLLTEFRARDPKLRDDLVKALAKQGFLAQEPFFQAHRPFKEGKPWRELGLDPRLAKVMEERSGSKMTFLHQSEAIAHLLSPDATPLVVTTGTGSGKTECFLLPAIQNAIEDAARFKKSGLTAILVYPMNALANDQDKRIQEYLESSGHTYVDVRRYDRSTGQDERAAMRKNPPHLLLTNYMMLEYLLVRPADREAIFANHRCRFVVLDEVHTYRGGLGANIALLFRRLRAHLQEAAQDFAIEHPVKRERFPEPVVVATSATIKSIDETGRARDEVRRLREEAVQEFLGTLTGVPRASFRVLGEELKLLSVPEDARWTAEPVALELPALGDAKATRRVIARLAGLPESAPVAEAVAKAKILWTLGELLAKKPLSLSGITDAVLAEVPERKGKDRDAVLGEVRAALFAGAQVGELPGALRLRAHRFLRGGWRFHRCVDPGCGHLYARGEGDCRECGKATAPLLLCRSCGADALHFRGADVPAEAPLEPWAGFSEEAIEWVLYDQARLSSVFDEEDEDEDEAEAAKTKERKAHQQMKGRKVRRGSFDPALRLLDEDESKYPVKVLLAPARTRCLVCGGSAGSGTLLTSVALGTSAALRVLAEGVVEGLAQQHDNDPSPREDKKERILIFADSRQDAAHQARFITYAGRYDRMRRRLVHLLEEKGGTLPLERAIRELMARGFENKDNPHTKDTRVRDVELLNTSAQERALAWEEAPLLDDLAVSAGYRATVQNLGLVGVRYGKLERAVDKYGGESASRLNLTATQLYYLSRCLLDEMRSRGALSRPMLTYHPPPSQLPRGVPTPRRLGAEVQDSAGLSMRQTWGAGGPSGCERGRARRPSQQRLAREGRRRRAEAPAHLPAPRPADGAHRGRGAAPPRRDEAPSGVGRGGAGEALRLRPETKLAPSGQRGCGRARLD